MYIHVVQPGDTLWNIARRYGVSTNRIVTDNGLSNPSRLVIGQALVILVPQTIYTIRPGDTLQSIAQRFGTTEIVLMQNNPELIGRQQNLPVGQVITIAFQGEKRRSIRVNGYAYPHIRTHVLERALPYLTTLCIFSYGVTTTGNLITLDDQPLINLAYQYQTAPVMTVSTITEDGNFSSERARIIFNNPELQNRLLDNIVANMQQKGYLGLDIDFEYIPPEESESYLAFLRKATERMHQEGFFVMADLAPKTSASQPGLLYEAHNYPAVGSIVDIVLLMTYEWGYTFGPPMAVAPLDQVRRVIEYGVSEIPPSKILMGMPNYGYDWPLPYEKGTTRATSIGNQTAVDIAARNGANIQYDLTAQSPHFEYFNNGTKHVVWFEDIRSMDAKFQLMDEFDLLGGSLWNLMRPFAQVWALISARYTVNKIVR